MNVNKHFTFPQDFEGFVRNASTDDPIYNSIMPEYRRVRIQGGTNFFTIIAYHRLLICTEDVA